MLIQLLIYICSTRTENSDHSMERETRGNLASFTIWETVVCVYRIMIPLKPNSAVTKKSGSFLLIRIRLINNVFWNSVLRFFCLTLYLYWFCCPKQPICCSCCESLVTFLFAVPLLFSISLFDFLSTLHSHDIVRLHQFNIQMFFICFHSLTLTVYRESLRLRLSSGLLGKDSTGNLLNSLHVSVFDLTNSHSQ